MTSVQDASRIAEAVAAKARFVKVEGPAGSGKTQVLVERAARLIGEGVDAQRIVVFAATRTAALELNRRLVQAGAESVLATTATEYAQRMLASEDAQVQTKRVPRILEDFEQRILTEDLKVTGIPPKRLREMLKFFYRTYSELGDESDDFLLSSEERLLSDALAGHLRARGAMLAQELTNVATKYLRSDTDKAKTWHFDYVLVDDFQDASKATQTMCNLLADTQLFVCGNAAQTVQTRETYPYPEGLASFEQEYDQAVSFILETNVRSGQAIVDAGNALVYAGDPASLQASCIKDKSSSLKVVQWTLPNAEFVRVAEYVASRVKGTRDPIHPRDVYLAVPNVLWGRALAKVLGDSGVKTATMLSYHALAGDPRDNEKNHSLRLFTLLNLAANSRDVAAWRNWCGFGDYLTHSNHWCRLEEYAAEQGKDVFDMLDRLPASSHEDEVFLGARVLADAYKQGLEIVQKAQGKSGFSLLSALNDGSSENLPADFIELIEPIDGTESAQELYKRAQAHTEIQFPDEDAVRIGLPQMAVGQQFDTVVVCGMVDGFYPPAQVFGVELEEDRKEQVLSQARRNLCVAMQAARKHVVLSCFARDEAASATKLGMLVRRIRDIDGKRMAILSPSCFIDEMGDAAPGIDTTL